MTAPPTALLRCSGNARRGTAESPSFLRKTGAWVLPGTQGLDKAKGKYIYFADPDDWCERTLLEKCRDSAEQAGSDFVAFGRDIYDEGENKTVKTEHVPATLVAMGSFSPENICDSLFRSFGCAPWNKLYSRDFIRHHGLRFQELPCNNDAFFTNASYLLAEKISVLPDVLYHYRRNRKDSLQWHRLDHPFTYFDVFEELDRVFADRGETVGCAYSYYLFRAIQHLTRLKEIRNLPDKYLVRKWVEEKIGGEYLIPLLGVYDRFEDIDFFALPDRFVVKANHGCGYNYIVKDKRKVDFDDMRKKVNGWLHENYGDKLGTELHYRNIEPKIVIEQYLENEQSHGDLYDYKFWCFNGRVEYVLFMSERNTDGVKMAFYDREWRKQPFACSYPIDNKVNEKPDNLEQMITLAEKLSAGFMHVRVDFYRLDSGKVYFGEMTFTSASGGGKWNTPGINERLGKLITLPELAYNVDTKEYFQPELTRSRMARSEETARTGENLKRLQAGEKKLKERNQELEKQLRQLREKEKKTAEFARALESSTSYRLGRVLTKWPHRLLSPLRKGK